MADRPPTTESKPAGPLDPAEVDWWLKEFAAEIEELRRDAHQTPSSAQRNEPGREPQDDLANPFPPGYAEDLLEE